MTTVLEGISASSNYVSSPGSQDASTMDLTIIRLMLLQAFALDFEILGAVRDLKKILQHSQHCIEITDAYDFSSEIISELKKQSANTKDGKTVLDTFKKWVICKALQEIWSYAIEFPKPIFDLHHGPVTDVEDSLDNVYKSTDKPDPAISGAYEQTRQKRFLNKLMKANRGTPFYDQKILNYCLEIALHVGRIKDNSQSDEDIVVNDLFGSDAHVKGIKNIEEDAGFSRIVNTIKDYMPDDILGCLNSAFLYNLVFAWERLFSDSESDIFDIISDRINKVEEYFKTSTSSQSMLDYRDESVTYIVNKIKLVKTDIRMQELWDLSRDPSPIQISATLRSLDALDAKKVFNVDDKTVFWSVKEPTYTVWWNYLRYFSLISEPKIAHLFKFALDNATEQEKQNLHIDKINASAMFPETFDPPYNATSISTLDFDKITRNNSLVGERLKKTGELTSALSGVTAL
jgi:hypothetical protein